MPIKEFSEAKIIAKSGLSKKNLSKIYGKAQGARGNSRQEKRQQADTNEDEIFEDLTFVGGQVKKSKSKPPINPINNNKFGISDSRLKGLETIYLKS